MSDYLELIDPQTRTCKLLYNGVIIEEYKIEQCDKCSSFQKLDAFGYQKGFSNEKLLWFCGGCR